jgi:hypothetical protein
MRPRKPAYFKLLFFQIKKINNKNVYILYYYLLKELFIFNYLFFLKIRKFHLSWLSWTHGRSIK